MPGGAVAPPATVAVTGASGFIGSWVCVRLLEQGFTVRAVVRDKTNAEKTAHLVKKAQELGRGGSLSFFSGDLSKPGDYDEAFAGADAVVHTAAVVAIEAKNPLKEIVEPSTEGTKNMLGSVGKSGTVKRVVHTSSVAAIQSYDKGASYIFTEADEATWSTIERGDPYRISAPVAVARRAATLGVAEPVCVPRAVTLAAAVQVWLRKACRGAARA
jgi:nucleoside-diphosphate-sugar epimerase